MFTLSYFNLYFLYIHEMLKYNMLYFCKMLHLVYKSGGTTNLASEFLSADII